jgi:hypothetical protein
MKTDAVDHHQAHDLIGCQDPAWDVAGAVVEFDLDEHEAMQLAAATGRSVDAEHLQFYELGYCAFRLGAAHLAEGPDSKSARRYAARARDLLHLHDGAATPRESLVG